jgi:phage tail sheath protein FI
VTDANPQQALVTHCETMFNRFAILDGVRDKSAGFPNLLLQYGNVRTPNGFAALYFPWIQVVNPATRLTEYWPPSGHVMGIYAQTDKTRGVYKAPANVPIAGALGLEAQLTDADQGPLNLLGIDILRVFREQSQPLVWGARTTSVDRSWQYISTRRLFILIEQSIEQGIRWAVFEVNNPLLWGKLKRTISEFLSRIKSDGGIIDYYVRIDAALNPPATQALGQLYIEIGVQPAYPAEFIILRIGIWQGGSSITEA